MKRIVERRPGYRQWLWIVQKNPITWAVLRSGLDPSTPEIYTDGAVEGSEHIVAAFTAAQRTFPGDEAQPSLPVEYWAARVQAEFIRPFAQTVLGGGPEACWVARPLKAEDVHTDVEGFAAIDLSGFQAADDMVRRSSLAWELYGADEFTLSHYAAVREQMDAAQTDSVTITVTHVPERSEIDEKLDAAELGVTKTGITGLPAVEKLVMKKSSDSLIDAIEHREVRNAADALKPGKYVKVRCEYIVNAKDPNRRRSCDKWSIGATPFCEIHGGTYLEEEEIRSVILAGQTKIAAATSKAIDTVVYLMQHATNETVKLASAKLLLDKAGFNDATEIIHRSEGAKQEDPSDVIRARLERLRGSGPALPAAPKDLFREDSTIEAEVVEEGDEEPDADGGVLAPV